MSGVRNVARAAAQRVYARWRRLPLREEVLLESFEGSAPGFDPAAIADHLLEHTDLSVIWALREPVPKALNNDRIRCVRYRSAAYYRTLATTKYLVNNVTFPPLFDKRDDQIYLNTWHGTPLKKMGRDVTGPFMNIANTVANFESADVLLSSGPYMTQTMYVDAYGIDPRNVVELGAPRVDVQFGARPQADLVLYAPTWQEASYTDALDDLDDVAERMQAIAASCSQGQLPTLRVHGKLADRAAADPRLEPFLAPARMLTNELLARTHTLITDFSSVAFDFLATGSRVVFFTPIDYPRGVYLTDAELPGPRTQSLAQLRAWLSHGPPDGPVPVAQARDRFCPQDDGRATRRVVERLLKR